MTFYDFWLFFVIQHLAQGYFYSPCLEFIAASRAIFTRLGLAIFTVFDILYIKTRALTNVKHHLQTTKISFFWSSQQRTAYTYELNNYEQYKPISRIK